MIFGECPYCEGLVSTNIAATIGVVSKETCPNCFKQYWLKHSRIDPIAYPLEAMEVNEETKTLKIKDGYDQT